jgi:alanine-glyoxylate transaminase/serine-glyoxylate transaminase/serine-pyruvate transaminase
MLMRSAASTLVRRNAAATRTASRAFASRTSPLRSEEKKVMYEAVPKADFGAFKEYSVIFTNRSLNLMSDPFQKVMRDLNTLLKATYNADKVAIIPGYVTLLLGT